MGEETVVLWRPTGPEELVLVEASGWRRWPARLPEQPIFYPVLNEEYATKIARDWNVAHSGVGYVTRFRVHKEPLSVACLSAGKHRQGGIDRKDASGTEADAARRSPAGREAAAVRWCLSRRSSSG